MPNTSYQDLPWSDMKVAFSADDDEAVWSHFGIGGSHLHLLPPGWSLNETNSSGARLVAVFRIEGVLPTISDGALVEKLLKERCQHV